MPMPMPPQIAVPAERPAAAGDREQSLEGIHDDNATEAELRKARLLVALQMSLLLLLTLLAAPGWLAVLQQGASAPFISRFGFALLLAAIALALWAILSFGRHNLTATPVPTRNNRLTRHGPYRVIRHPMYASLLLLSISLLCVRPVWASSVVALGLIGVLVLKINLEERLLLRRHGDYAAYRQKTWRLIPGLY